MKYFKKIRVEQWIVTKTNDTGSGSVQYVKLKTFDRKKALIALSKDNSLHVRTKKVTRWVEDKECE